MRRTALLTGLVGLIGAALWAGQATKLPSVPEPIAPQPAALLTVAPTRTTALAPATEPAPVTALPASTAPVAQPRMPPPVVLDRSSASPPPASVGNSASAAAVVAPPAEREMSAPTIRAAERPADASQKPRSRPVHGHRQPPASPPSQSVSRALAAPSPMLQPIPRLAPSPRLAHGQSTGLAETQPLPRVLTRYR